MPHYYFHVHNGLGVIEDEEGRDLPDRATAHKEALKSIRSILSEDVLAGCLDLQGRIDVVEDGGSKPALTVPFDEAVDIRI